MMHLRRTALVFTLSSIALMAAGFSASAAKDAAKDAAGQTGATLSGNYLAGRHAQVERDMAAAATYLAAALKLDPGRPELVRRAFVLMLTEGRMAEAVELAKEIAEISGEGAIASTTLVIDAIRQQRYAEALTILEAMPMESINVFIVPPLKAWTKVGLGDLDGALKAINAHDDTNGGSNLFNLHRGLILDLAGRPEDAIEALTKVADSKVGLSLRVAQILGGIYERQGKPENAREVYEGYQAEQPDSKLLEQEFARVDQDNAEPPKPLITTPVQGSAEAMFGIASSLRQQNASETALVFARMALWLRPDFPPMQVVLADILENDGRLEEAITVYRAIDADSGFGFAANMRIAMNLSRLDRLNESAKLLEALAKQAPTDPEPLVRLGNLYRFQEHYDDAIDAYNKAFKRIDELGPSHWSLLYSRGIAYERDDQWEKAEADFLKALEFQPDHPLVLNYLGYSWVDQGLNLERALEMIRTAVHLRPNDGYIVDSLGWAYYKLKRYEDAVVELERAVELRPHDPIINDHLGDALWRVGRKIEARFQWRRALSMKPDADVEATLKKKLDKGLDVVEGNGT